MPRLNRRQLTRSLITGAATAAAGASLSAQAPPAGDELLATAKRQVVSNREVLDKIKLPMATEPASSFKAS